jgi:threonyl-tRNA synthetase
MEAAVNRVRLKCAHLPTRHSPQRQVQPQPEFLEFRVKMFEELKKKYDEEVKAKPRVPISITLPDGSVKDGTAWETSPMDIAKGISAGLSQRVVIAKVDGVLFDLLRPLEADCKLELLDFDHADGSIRCRC